MKKSKEIRSLPFSLAITLVAMTIAACEKPILNDESVVSDSVADKNLQITITQLEDTPFNTSSESPTCTRLNFVVYDEAGNRLQQTNQQQGTTGFGTAAFQLDAGTYRLVVLAHSSNGNPTLTNPAKIQFTNATGYTDTFLYYAVVEVDDEPQALSLSLRRITSLCRVVIADAIPDEVTCLEFTYKGGSGAFAATTGLGVVNSTQVVKYAVKGRAAPTQYDLYTFLHDTSGTLRLTAKAYDIADQVLMENTYEVPLEQDKVTQLTDTFFSGESSGGIRITINDQWYSDYPWPF